MARWTAINQAIDETPEPIIVPNQKHTEIMETYNYALGLMSNEHWKKAQEVFEGLLRKEGFANMSVEKFDGMNWSQADVSARLYVAVCKNYARVLEMIWEKDNEASVARKAMGLYERSLNVDPSDYVTWYRLGVLGLKLRYPSPAVIEMFFRQAMELSEPTTSPVYILSLCETVRLCWDLGRFEAGLKLAEKGLQTEPNFKELNILKEQLEKTWAWSPEDPETFVHRPHLSHQSHNHITRRAWPTVRADEVSFAEHSYELDLCTWKGLGELLLKVYDTCTQTTLSKEEKRSDDHVVLINIKPHTYDSMEFWPPNLKKRKSNVNTRTTSKRARRNSGISSGPKASGDKTEDESKANFINELEKIVAPIDEGLLMSVKEQDEIMKIELFMDRLENMWVSAAADEFINISGLLEENECRQSSNTRRRFIYYTKTSPSPEPVILSTNSVQQLVISLNERKTTINVWMAVYLLNLFAYHPGAESSDCRSLWFSGWPDGMAEIVLRVLNSCHRTLLQILCDEQKRINKDSAYKWIREGLLRRSEKCEIDNSEFRRMRELAEIAVGLCEFLVDQRTSLLQEDRCEQSPCVDELERQPIHEEYCLYEELFKYADDKLCDIQAVVEQIVALHDPTTLDDQRNTMVKQLYYYYSEWSRITQLRTTWSNVYVALSYNNTKSATLLLSACKSIVTTQDSIYIPNRTWNPLLDLSKIHELEQCLLAEEKSPIEAEWICAVKTLHDLVFRMYTKQDEDLVESPITPTFQQVNTQSNAQPSQQEVRTQHPRGRPPRDIAVREFWEQILHLNNELKRVAELIKKNSLKIAMLPDEDVVRFRQTISVLHNICIHILFSDESRNYDYDLTPVADIIAAFIVRVYIVICRILKNEPTRNGVEFNRWLMMEKYFDLVHDALAENWMCCADEGSFLKAVLREYYETDIRIETQELLCCYCLYNIPPPNDSDLEKHKNYGDKTKSVEFKDLGDIEPVFRVIVKTQSEWIKSATARNAVKDILDVIATKVSEYDKADRVGGETGRGLMREVYNCRQWLQSYLGSSIQFYKAINLEYTGELLSPMRCRQNYTLSLDHINSHLHYLRGKIRLHSVKARSRHNAAKANDLIERAIEVHEEDIAYNPERFASWYALAYLYSCLAEEKLIYSAVEINRNFIKIAEYQRKAFLCYAQSAHTLKLCPIFNDQPQAPIEDQFNFWRGYGYHVYSMIAKPMRMAAFRKDHLANMNVDVYTWAAKCFGTAFAFERQICDQKDWTLPYMLAMCSYKILGDAVDASRSKKILRLLKVSAALTPQTLDRNSEIIVLEPQYKLLSVLTKYYLKNLFTASDVCDCLESDHSDESYSRPISIPDGRDAMIGYFIDQYEALRTQDTGGWYHRPIYKVAMLKALLGRYEEAKSDMQNLVQVKAKSVINVWKNEFERPGRHFVYVQQYIVFLIELLDKTNDLELLRLLEHKIRNWRNVTLDLSAIDENLRKAKTRLMLEESRAMAERVQIKQENITVFTI